MATSFHMEALRRQRIIERAAAARLRLQSAIQEASQVGTPHSLVNEPARLSQQSNRSATASVHTPSTAHTQSRQSNRTLSKHSSHHSRPSTAATLTRENVGKDDPAVLSRPASSRGSRPALTPPNSSQQQKPESNNQPREVGSRNEKREGITPVKSREGSKLGERPERSGSAVSSVKPKSASKSQTSSKRTSPVPEETTEAVGTKVESSRPPSVVRSRLSCKRSDKQVSQDIETTS